MRATVITGPGSIELREVSDPKIIEPTDAIVRITASCVCGSDLWHYRGEAQEGTSRRIGHEMVGVVEEVGNQVRSVQPGDFVVSPFSLSCGTCPNCANGMQSACVHGAFWGGGTEDACQGEAARVPMADGTLVATPEPPDESLLPSLLTLADVMPTGWHGAVSAGVTEGSTTAVVGDGAVGLCAVLSASMMGADRIIMMSKYPARQALAREFGATHIIADRGDAAVSAVHDLTEGIGADAVIECVGTDDAFSQAFRSARPGARVGFVGIPHGVTLDPLAMFITNVGVQGGMAPVRAYLPDLMTKVLEREIEPGKVFDLMLPLTEVSEGYAAMDERRAIKSMLLSQ